MLYLVFIAIDRAIALDWLDWMQSVHIPDVLATGCFERAYLTRDPGLDTEDRDGYRVVYLCPDRLSLDKYTLAFAPELQQEHTARYEGRFDARREVLEVLASFGY
jgi:hypothetical protein